MKLVVCSNEASVQAVTYLLYLGVAAANTRQLTVSVASGAVVGTATSLVFHEGDTIRANISGTTVNTQTMTLHGSRFIA